MGGMNIPELPVTIDGFSVRIARITSRICTSSIKKGKEEGIPFAFDSSLENSDNSSSCSC